MDWDTTEARNREPRKARFSLAPPACMWTAKAFPDAKLEQYLERLDQKLRSATHSTFSVKPRRTTPRDKLQSIVIPASGLDCKACCLAAYESIANLDGVEQATASFNEGKVTALIDPTKTDKSKLEEALRKKGVAVGK